MVRVGSAHVPGISADPARFAGTRTLEDPSRLRVFARESRHIRDAGYGPCRIESAHIIGAKTGASVAMRFAADHPRRTRSLVVAGGPVVPVNIENPSPIPQRDRLGSRVSKEMIDYWNQIFATANREGTTGLNKAMSNFDLAKEGVLQRIMAPTLVITGDQSKMHSVEKARAYQRLIPNSRLAVIRSDAYHIAAANAEECVRLTLAFLREQSKS